MSNSHKLDYAPGKTKGTGKLGSFCQGFTESDCDKAKSACNWIKAKNPYCARRTDSKANMNALSKFNDNKTLSNAKELAKITIAFSMYHENGERMTELQIYENIESYKFKDMLLENIFENYGVIYGLNYEAYDMHLEVSDNLILVTMPVAAIRGESLDVNDTIRQIQRDFNRWLERSNGIIEYAEDVFIKSITIISQEDTTYKGFNSRKKALRGVVLGKHHTPEKAKRVHDRAVNYAKKSHKEMMESLARGEEL